jgi:hypothetical protein
MTDIWEWPAPSVAKKREASYRDEIETRTAYMEAGEDVGLFLTMTSWKFLEPTGNYQIHCAIYWEGQGLRTCSGLSPVAAEQQEEAQNCVVIFVFFLYSQSNIMSLIKLRCMKWARNVVYVVKWEIDPLKSSSYYIYYLSSYTKILDSPRRVCLCGSHNKQRLFS